MLTHVYQILRERAARSPSSIALGGQSGLAWRIVTSQQLLELAGTVARRLGERDIREGDRVVVWVPNSWRTPVYLFALWKLGAIVVPFDREMNPESAVRILSSVNARAVVAGYDERPVWANGADVIGWWEPHSDAGAERRGSEWSSPGEELATISFTSGTTGQPKGCMITHANLCSQVDAAFKVIPLDPSCRLASILPMSHLFELTCGLLYPLAAGAAIHYIPSRRGPDIVRVLAEQHITHMMVVPQLLGLIGQQIEAQLQASLPKPLYMAQAALAERLTLTWRRQVYWMVHRKLGGELRMLASGGAAPQLCRRAAGPLRIGPDPGAALFQAPVGGGGGGRTRLAQPVGTLRHAGVRFVSASTRTGPRAQPPPIGRPCTAGQCHPHLSSGNARASVSRTRE